MLVVFLSLITTQIHYTTSVNLINSKAQVYLEGKSIPTISVNVNKPRQSIHQDVEDFTPPPTRSVYHLLIPDSVEIPNAEELHSFDSPFGENNDMINYYFDGQEENYQNYSNRYEKEDSANFLNNFDDDDNLNYIYNDEDFATKSLIDSLDRIARSMGKDCYNRKAAKLCNKACKKAINKACKHYVVKSSLRSKLKSECKKKCNSEFD